MSDEIEKKRRPIVFKVSRTDTVNERGQHISNVIVAEPFETSATDEEISEWVKAQVRNLREIRHVKDNAPANKDPLKVKRFAIYIHDLDTDKKSAPILLVGGDSDTEESLRKDIVRAIEDDFQQYISNVYKAMIRYVEAKGWYFDKITDQQWREVCGAVHPFFYSSDWSEKRRAKFEQVSWDTITKKLRDRVYKSKNFRPKRTKGRSSVQSTDEKPFVRKSTRREPRKALRLPKVITSNRKRNEATRSRKRTKARKSRRSASR